MNIKNTETLELNLMYVYKNKSTTTTTFDVFVSVTSSKEPGHYYQYIINVRWKVTYIKGTFTLYYTGAMTKATKLRHKEFQVKFYKKTENKHFK